MTESVAQVVRRRRLELGLSQAAAAELAGVSRKTWCDVELGYRRGGDDTLALMTAVLQLPASLTEIAVDIPSPRSGPAPELGPLRQEVIDLILLLPREELEQARVAILRRKVERLQARLEELG